MTTVLRSSRPHPVLRVLPYAGAAAVTALVLAGCGGGSSTTTAAPVQGSTPAPTATGGSGNGQGQGQRQPGVSGLIAAVNGSTMQVQTRTDQTAVSWTGATTFTKTASASLADVTVGSCVTAVDTSAAGATGAPATTPPTQVSASVVQVRPATNGECTGGGFGGGFGGGGGGAGAPTAPPTRTGTATPGDRGQGGGFGGRAVNGKVTAVSGSTITVEETVRARGQGTATATAGTQQSVTVTTTASTTYTAEKAAAASDVTVGECATALGKADDTGSVAATAISLRPATNGSCTGGGRGANGTATTSATKGA